MITFGWDLCYTCNYRCPYCGGWEKESERDIVLSPEKWGNIWDRIFNLYGKCHIFMSGGEPSVYPGFYELIRILSEKHLPEICTNLSWDINRLVPGLHSDKLRIAPTFHPAFSDFEEFFKKAVTVKEYLNNSQIYYVAHPDNIEEMPERSKRLKEKGIDLIPIPLRNVEFVLNSEKDKRIIEEISPYKNTDRIKYQLQEFSPRNKLCRSGRDYAVIRTNGLVDRCSQYNDGIIGNIFDANFRLLEKPSPCSKDYCPIESQWLEGI